jgi:tripartite-type tricarboxylate transporter receptor subunit TctC
MDTRKVTQRWCIAGRALAGLVASCVVTGVCAQDYPAKPVRFVTSAPGGGSDIVLRLIGPLLLPTWGQPLVIDNRGYIGAEIVSKSAPDGYTVLLDGASTWITPLLQKTPYDPMKDFSPVMVPASTPNVLAVHVSVPVNSVTELIALAKAQPGKLNFASGGTGGTSHLAPELFKSMTGTNMVHVPYRGTGPAAAALVAGEVQLLFASAASVLPHVKSGKIKALAVCSARPSSLTPGLPPVSDSVPGFESVLLLGMFVPAKTPPAVVHKLNKDIARALAAPDIVARLASAGLEPVANSPEEFTALLRTDLAKWGKLIKDAAIRVN